MKPLVLIASFLLVAMIATTDPDAPWATVGVCAAGAAILIGLAVFA